MVCWSLARHDGLLQIMSVMMPPDGAREVCAGELAQKES